MKTMTSKQLKFMIIENFVNHWTTDPDSRDRMMDTAHAYVEGDHVDEIIQAGWKPKHPVPGPEETIRQKIDWVKAICEHWGDIKFKEFDGKPIEIEKYHHINAVDYHGVTVEVSDADGKYVESYDLPWGDLYDDHVELVYQRACEFSAFKVDESVKGM